MKLSVTFIVVLLTLSVYAAQYQVDPNGGFDAIQAAIDNANAGDQIVLSPGVYTGTTGQSIYMINKFITLRSQDPNDAAVVRGTVLQCSTDAGESAPAIYFEAGYEGAATFAGFTITGGLTQPAIVCSNNEDYTLILDSCVIRDNQAGGIYGSEMSLSLVDCVFQHNQAEEGGALNCRDSRVEMQDCVFIENSADNQGGGIYLDESFVRAIRCQWMGNQAESGAGLYSRDDSSVLVDNSIWVGNRASEIGGGMMLEGSLVELENCSLAGNVADEEGGAMAVVIDSLSMINCIVAYNQDMYGLGRSITGTSSGRGGRSGRTTLGIEPEALMDDASISHSCLQLDPEETEAFVEANDITTDDPMFVSIPNGGSDGWGDDPKTVSIDESLNDDYGDLRLRVGSPCINTGSSLTWASVAGQDLDGGIRQMGPATDMGAYEFDQPTLKVTRPQGDEIWAASSSQQLTWTSIGTDEPVDILFRTAPDCLWEPLAKGIANRGSYQWDLSLYYLFPGLESSDWQIRVTLATSDPNQYIEDSATFTVVPDQNGVETISSWSTLAGNAQHTGQALFEGPLAPIDAWDINIPGELYTSVTLGTDDHLHVASESGVLYTFSSSGQAIWMVDVNTPLLTAPTVGPDGSVYVGAQDGRLYAFTHEGAFRWTWETEGFLFASATVSETGTVYVAAQDGTLYALSNNGSLLWSFQAPTLNNITDAFLASPALDTDGNVLIGSLYEPRLYALAPDDGTVLWSCLCADPDAVRMSEKGSIVASAVVDANTTIYQGLIEDPNLYAIDVQTGDILWKTDLVELVTLLPEEPEDSGGGGRSGRTSRETTLAESGIIGTVEPGDSIWTEPALGPDGTVYASLNDPYLRAVSPNGTVQWVIQLGIGQGFSLTVGADGMIYAAGADGVLYVINRNGQVVAEHSVGNSLIYPVIGNQGGLILTDVDHGLRVYQDLF